MGDNLSDTYGAVAPALRNAPGSDVLVIGGTGSVGVFAVTFAKALGASSVSYVDAFDPDCVELARRLGAEILDEAPRGREFPVTFDASRRPRRLRRPVPRRARRAGNRNGAAEVGGYLTQHPDIAHVHITGSAPTQPLRARGEAVGEAPDSESGCPSRTAFAVVCSGHLRVLAEPGGLGGTDAVQRGAAGIGMGLGAGRVRVSRPGRSAPATGRARAGGLRAAAALGPG